MLTQLEAITNDVSLLYITVYNLAALCIPESNEDLQAKRAVNIHSKLQKVRVK